MTYICDETEDVQEVLEVTTHNDTIDIKTSLIWKAEDVSESMNDYVTLNHQAVKALYAQLGRWLSHHER